MCLGFFGGELQLRYMLAECVAEPQPGGEQRDGVCQIDAADVQSDGEA